MIDSFPRQSARTQRFTLGEPRSLTIDENGDRVLFLRSDSGTDSVHHLWSASLDDGTATKLVDARLLLGSDDADLSPQEQARRERLREGADGITTYSTDAAMERATFTLGGRLFVTELKETLDDGSCPTTEVTTERQVFDPQLSPDGTMIGFVSGAAFVVVSLDGQTQLEIVESDPAVSWGTADFVAAEEMRRLRGFWWAPDSTALAVCRNDTSNVPLWFIGNPAQPTAKPIEHRYPNAGATNPHVELFVTTIDGARTEAEWDHERYEYLPRVLWNTHGLTITVQSRDQRNVVTLTVDPASGSTSILGADHHPDWVELTPGSPAIIGPGSDGVVSAADRDGTRRILIGAQAVTPPELQVRSIISATSKQIIFAANPLDDPTVQHIYRYSDGATNAVATGAVIATAVVSGDVTIVRTATIEQPGSTWNLPSGAILESVAEQPIVQPNLTFDRGSGDRLATAVLLPPDHDGSPLPVLLDPYGGPHAQRVVRSYNAMCTSQWFADQGFAVVIIDGRGTPGRGTAFERAVRDDLADGVLADQITGLHTAAQWHPELDLSRVAIRGWSFGGYLAALAVLKRPDIFHAAIAGAPVTEWRLYDTHYTERYLGHPDRQPGVYDANSLLPLAPSLQRPLLLIHGLADDNVVAAHTLQLSAALLAAGCEHEVLPLVGVSHMTPQEVIAENLMEYQLAFLRRNLGLATVVE